MARKRSDNKKWMSRPSRKNRTTTNNNTKPCQIRRNNSKLTSNRRKKIDDKEKCSIPRVNLETEQVDETSNALMTHNYLSERYIRIMLHIICFYS